MNSVCRGFYLAGVLVFLSPFVASALVVDDFRDGALEWSLSVSTSTSSQTALIEALDPSHTVGGKRQVFGSTGDTANLQIVPEPGFFEFDATVSWGYFQLLYGSSTEPLDVDLLADGSDAFLLTFPEVTPGLWRGSYNFSLESPSGGRSYRLASDLYALNGPGSIQIPFSYFTGADLRHVTSLTLVASRVEPTYRIRLGCDRDGPRARIMSVGAGGSCDGISLARALRPLKFVHKESHLVPVTRVLGKCIISVCIECGRVSANKPSCSAASG